MSKHYRSLTALFALWLLAWLYASWPATQDDAFIHLRYAVNLLRYHMISYNGVHPEYGISSLLYVWLLAGLRIFSKSPVLPRAVSSVFHLLLFAGLAWEFPKALGGLPGAPSLKQTHPQASSGRPSNREEAIAWGFALVLLGILVTPMAVRWLDDGMETSLTLCLVSLLAFSVSRQGHSEVLRKRSLAWLAILGFTATLARVEYLLLMGVASLTLFLARAELHRRGAAPNTVPDPKPSRISAYPRLAAACLTPLAGSLLAAGLIYGTMHALLPDTAVAKAALHTPWGAIPGIAFGVLGATLSVFVSAMSIGILLLLFWLLTAAALVVYRRRLSLSMLAANCLFPVVLLLAALRGQQVQGVRYLLWTLLFPILWNILELRWGACRSSGRSLPAGVEQPPGAELSPRAIRWLTMATRGVVGLLLISVPVGSVLLYREFHARERSLAEFQEQHLERLHSLKLVAFDVGYIGYFTGSPVCDMAGLVNGLARAELPFEQRVRVCAAEDPQYAFVSGFSLAELKHAIDLKDWSLCSVYDFANLRGPDPHYLIASPAAAREVCAAAGDAPRPLAPLLHAGSL